MCVAERLKMERKRLGLSQTEVGLIAGVGKTTVINWEKSVGAPDAVQLFELAKKGFNIAYIVTGSLPITPIVYTTGGMATELKADQVYLSSREAALLDDFRSLSDVEKDAAETMLNAVAKSKKIKKA